MMRIGLAIAFLALGCLATPAEAAWPWKGPWPWSSSEGSRRIDVIGPIGNRLPPSYRRKYNRPTYLGGKIAAKIEPSSQEAMAFHRAEELGLYDNNGIKGALSCQHCPPQRVEQHYFYPKPWEVLAVGPRRNVRAEAEPKRDSSPSSRFQRSTSEQAESVRPENEPIHLDPPVRLTPTDEIMPLPPPTGDTE